MTTNTPTPDKSAEWELQAGAVISAFRAELQKPALQTKVAMPTREEIGRLMLEASTGIHGRVAQIIVNEWAKIAEKTLQGRAKPALQANAARAQEEITDAELLRACINASDSLNITRVHEIGGKTRTIMEDAGLLEIARAAIRASKGEKT